MDIRETNTETFLTDFCWIPNRECNKHGSSFRREPTLKPRLWQKFWLWLTHSSSKTPVCFLNSSNYSHWQLSPYLRAWSPERQRPRCCATNVPALGQSTAHKATPIPSSKTFLILNCRDQNPKGKGDFCLHHHLNLACSNFFSSPHTSHTPDWLLLRNAAGWENSDDTALGIHKTTAAPGDPNVPFALCQMSPVILPCCNLNAF